MFPLLTKRLSKNKNNVTVLYDHATGKKHFVHLPNGLIAFESDKISTS